MADTIRLNTANYNLPADRVISKNWEFSLFYIYVFLAFFHIPLFWFADDSIGLYDFYQIFYLLVLLLRCGSDRISIPKNWDELFVVVSLYLSYLLLGYIIIHNPYSTVLMIKHVQYFIGLFIVASFFYKNRQDTEQIIFVIQSIFLLMIIFQILNLYSVFDRIGLHGWLGYGTKYRLCLPLKMGTSSNPAGFVLGVFLIYSWEIILRQYKKNFTSIVTFVLALAALFLTVSRTNIFAFFVVIILSLIIRLITQRKYFLYFTIIVVAIIVLFIILLRYLPKTSKIWSFLRLIQNPSAIIKDTAFHARYASMWVVAIKNWLENPFTFLFGKGIGYTQWVDGTVQRLLGNQGIVGLFFFLYVWIYYFLKNSPNNKALFLLMVFVLINGINGETLIVSFRTVQIYVVFLVMFIFSYKYKNDLKC